jgi:ribonucleoside-diphosphate reductase alpha chain
LNLEKFEEWKGTNIVQDLVRLLDNVLEYFIRLAPKELSRAIYSASKERAVGTGTLGWHSYLQSKMIPFEGGGFNSAIQHTNIVYGLLKKKAIEESKRLAVLRGEAPDCEGSGMRNSHLFAIAPNASSSSLVGASPSIEPFAGNAFNAEGRAGSFLIKNKYLKKLLETKGQDTDEVWSSVVINDGSVQHLDCLTDEEKAVFKTAYEINPMWIVEQAGERQKHICQSQSVNLFTPADITAQELSDIHITAWVKGLKSLYYCRGKGAAKASVGTGTDKPLNAVAVRTKIEYDQSGCLSCEG